MNAWLLINTLTRIGTLALLVWSTVLASAGLGDDTKGPSTPDFATQIRPLLADRCFACHGPSSADRQAELRIDDFSSLTAERDSGQVLVPKDAKASLLWQRITNTDPDGVMPPPETGKPLTEREIELLTDWINAGAPWQKHWAYELPREIATPSISVAESLDGSANWIDCFLAEKIQTFGGEWSPEADRVTVARRLAFDLTGLPPEPTVVEQFASDRSPDAYERLVDHFLSTPAFGERLAVYWLDLVRFADTVGYHGDQDHHITPYRDYVINALNDNMPLDQFTREQLAGDLLEGATDEQIVATGYNRMLQTSHEGGVQPKEYLSIYAADRVRNLSVVWMGATVGCAQCHDHKFDPYTSRDFYNLAAFFADVDEAQHLKGGADSVPTKRLPEKEFLTRSIRLQKEQLERRLNDFRREQTELLGQAGGAVSVRLDELDRVISENDSELKSLSSKARKSMVTVSIAPREMRVLPRGNWLDDSGDVVSSGTPEFLGATRKSPDRLTRLDLANWLIDPRDGIGLLTARVFANRFWFLMFGEGLSRSLDDFGGQGEPPSHPELLDRLAIEFLRSGWDIKHFFRLVANSRAYRQSSLETLWHREHDIANRLFARQNRFRLPAEMVRDTALACSDLLVRSVGGPSVKPYQPEDYYKHLNFPARKYRHDLDTNQWRRGVYIHWQRQFLHPMLRAFDAPSREECTAIRPRSNTPLAALVWLNDPSFVEAARGLAVRALATGDTDDRQRIEGLFRIATSRPPDKIERQVLTELLASARSEYRENSAGAKQLLEVGMFRPDMAAIGDAELAAWTTVARSVLNLNETYTRN